LCIAGGQGEWGAQSERKVKCQSASSLGGGYVGKVGTAGR
jgi:hypothetical protein